MTTIRIKPPRIDAADASAPIAPRRTPRSQDMMSRVLLGHQSRQIEFNKSPF
jgi:hypothetical protein